MSRKKGVIYSYILMVFEILSSMLFTPFLIRSFGQGEYGIYSLVLSITAYLALLDLGVGNAIVRYMAKFKVNNDNTKQREMLAITICFYTFVGILALIAGKILQANLDTFFGKGLNPEEILRAQKMFSVTMVTIALTLFFGAFNKIIIAFEKFSFHKIIEIIKIILRVGISVFVLIGGGKGFEILTINFALTILFGIVSVLFVTIKLKVTPKFSDIELSFAKEIFSYSSFIFLQMIATQIISMADRILIGALVSSSAAILGIYAVGVQINQYFNTIAASVNGVLMPGVVRLVEKDATPEACLNEMVRVGRILFIMLGMIWSVFLVQGQDFMILWAGEANKEAYFVAIILMTPTMLTLIQAIGTQLLWAKNEHKIQAYMKFMSAFLTIALIVMLIKWRPLIGACIGTAIAIIIGDIVVMNIVYRKKIGISMKKYYYGLCKGIVPSIVITAIVGIASHFIVRWDNWTGFLIRCTITAFAYVMLMYLKGFNEYEKNLMKNILLKVKRRG